MNTFGHESFVKDIAMKFRVKLLNLMLRRTFRGKQGGGYDHHIMMSVIVIFCMELKTNGYQVD